MLAIWFGISNTCGGVWLNGLKQNRETNEEHDDDCVEEGLQLARVKLDKDVEGGSEALGMGNRSINIWDGSKLELAWSDKSSSYFENNFTIFLSYGISNTLIFKGRDVLLWVNLLVMLGQVVFEYVLCPLYFLLLRTSFIYIKSFFTFPNDSSFVNNLINVKTNTILTIQIY